MAQTGFTPISTYYTTTASAVPTAGNLVNGELALNINTADGKLFYKDSAGVVQVLATRDSTSGSFTNLSYTGTLTGGTGVVNLGSGQFYKDASGNVGIGTNTPTRTLDVLGTQSFRDVTGAKQLLIANDTSLVRLFSRNVSDNSDIPMGFYTGATERMRIDSSGNVGIGTSSPTAKLHVASSVTTNLKIETSGGSAQLILNSSGTNVSYINYGQTGANPLAFYDSNASAERMRIDSSGNLLVGTTSNSVTAGGLIQRPNNGGTGSSAFVIGHASGTASGDYYQVFFYNSSIVGSITQNGTTGVLYNLTSDYRLKNNPTPLTDSSEFIMALQPKIWDWWDGSGKGVGFIAHEFMEVAKHSGNGEKDAVDKDGKPVYQSIQPSSSEVMANLVAFVQEQQAMIETLTTRLNALEGK